MVVEVLKERWSHYNCGGYALGTNTWYLPYPEEYRECLETDRKGMGSYLEYMLEDFGGRLRIIDSLDELQSDEYAIAFRTRLYDFHYMRRGDDGMWYHKQGAQPEIHRVSDQVALDETKEWPNGYHSPICLMAMKKE